MTSNAELFSESRVEFFDGVFFRQPEVDWRVDKPSGVQAGGSEIGPQYRRMALNPRTKDAVGQFFHILLGNHDGHKNERDRFVLQHSGGMAGADLDGIAEIARDE